MIAELDLSLSLSETIITQVQNGMNIKIKICFTIFEDKRWLIAIKPFSMINTADENNLVKWYRHIKMKMFKTLYAWIKIR